MKQMLGSRLGWLSRWTPKAIAAGAALCLIAAAVFRRPIPGLRRSTSLATMVLVGASFSAIFLLLYLQYTPVGSDHVDGVQGRYMLPLLGALPLVAPGATLPLAWARRLDLSVALAAAAVGIATTGFVWRSYWA